MIRASVAKSITCCPILCTFHLVPLKLVCLFFAPGSLPAQYMFQFLWNVVLWNSQSLGTGNKLCKLIKKMQMCFTRTHPQWLLGKAATLLWPGLRTTMVTYLSREMVEWNGSIWQTRKVKRSLSGLHGANMETLPLLLVLVKMSNCLGATLIES